MKKLGPKAVLILLLLRIAAYFLIGFGVVLVLLGAVQHFYLRTAAPVLFPGHTTTVGLICMALGGLFFIGGVIMAVWLRFVEKRWTPSTKAKAKGQKPKTHGERG